MSAPGITTLPRKTNQPLIYRTFAIDNIASPSTSASTEVMVPVNGSTIGAVRSTDIYLFDEVSLVLQYGGVVMGRGRGKVSSRSFFSHCRRVSFHCVLSSDLRLGCALHCFSLRIKMTHLSRRGANGVVDWRPQGRRGDASALRFFVPTEDQRGASISASLSRRFS
jgi:hypothetical protein